MALHCIKRLNLLNQFARKFSSEAKLVALNVDDKTGVATATLQRPPVNSLNLDLLTDISTTLTEVEKNKSRGLILTSSSSSVFSAGLDILEMYKPDPERVKKFWVTLQDVWIKLYGSSYPTVAVINGHSPAGGCLLALCCEYRVMSEKFTIGLNETQLGIIAPKWFIATIRNVIGQRQTEAALTAGRLFSTEEALSIGLVDEIVTSKQEGIAKAHSFFERFAKIPPMARSLTKKSVREETITEMVKDRENDLNTFIQFSASPQVQKSLEFYLEGLKKKAAKK